MYTRMASICWRIRVTLFKFFAGVYYYSVIWQSKMLKVANGMGYHMVIRSLPSKPFCVVLVNYVRFRREKRMQKRHKRKGSKGNACRQTPWFRRTPSIQLSKICSIICDLFNSAKANTFNKYAIKTNIMSNSKSGCQNLLQQETWKKIRIPYNSRLWRCIPRSNSVTQNKQATRLTKSVPDLFLLYFTGKSSSPRILFWLQAKQWWSKPQIVDLS